MQLASKISLLILFVIALSCTKEVPPFIDEFYFSGKINGEEVRFDLDSLKTFPLSSISQSPEDTFVQVNRLGIIWNAGSEGIDILLTFARAPKASEIENLAGQMISFDQKDLPNIALKVYYKERISEVESTYLIDQTDSYFEILEVKKIPNIEDTILSTQNLENTYWVKGKCAFKTETFSIKDGEFAIMLGEFP